MSGPCVVVPVLDGAATVGQVVAGLRRETGLEVIVVDDGSVDGSGESAAAAGAFVVRHPVNRGKGAALQTGFATALRRGFSSVITVDADGQHDPREAARLAAAHAAAPDALVVGIRSFDPALMPRRSRTGNRVSTWFISRYAGRLHHDTQSGFRVYPRFLVEYGRWRSSRFDTESEALLVAAKLGVPLVEVPVKTIYAPGEGRTHFHGFVDTMRIIFLVFFSPLWRLRR